MSRFDLPVYAIIIESNATVRNGFLLSVDPWLKNICFDCCRHSSIRHRSFGLDRLPYNLIHYLVLDSSSTDAHLSMYIYIRPDSVADTLQNEISLAKLCNYRTAAGQ